MSGFSGRSFAIVCLVSLAQELPLAASDAADSRRPVPSPDAQKRAEASVKKVYKREYAQRSAAAKKAFARRLLEKGRDSADPAVRFVMFRESRDVASEGGDAPAVLSAVIALATVFRVHPVEMAEDALSRVSRTAREPDEFRDLVEVSLLLSLEARRADDFGGAKRLLSLARSSVKKARDATLPGEVRQADRELKIISKEHRKVAGALKTLSRENPDDPEANMAVGRYLCFTKGEWRKGLPLLAKSTDPSLADLARSDREAGEDPSAHLVMGDVWWESAAELKGLERSNVLLRSGWWYARCFSKLEGLRREKVSQRLNELSVELAPTPARSLTRGRRPEGFVLVKFDGKSLRGWEAAVGVWRVAAKHIVSAGGNDDRFLRSVPAATWQRVVFEFRGGNPGLYFCASEREVGGPGVNLDSDARFNGEIRMAVDAARWHTLLVELLGQELKFILDGLPVYSAYVSSPSHILLKAHRGELRVRKLVAVGLNDE